jgi:hypothetical protein
MQKLIRWSASRGHWSRSEFLGLPLLQLDADPELQRWQVVAGGLALVLSRLAPSEGARYTATHKLYNILRRRLRRRAAITPTSELLNDVMHEIALVADPLTIKCLRAGFHGSLGHGRALVEGEAEESRATSRLQSQPRPSRLHSRWEETHQQKQRAD